MLKALDRWATHFNSFPNLGELPFSSNARFRSNFQYPRYLGSWLREK